MLRGLRLEPVLRGEAELAGEPPDLSVMEEIVLGLVTLGFGAGGTEAFIVGGIFAFIFTFKLLFCSFLTMPICLHFLSLQEIHFFLVSTVMTQSLSPKQ